MNIYYFYFFCERMAFVGSFDYVVDAKNTFDDPSLSWTTYTADYSYNSQTVYRVGYSSNGTLTKTYDKTKYKKKNDYDIINIRFKIYFNSIEFNETCKVYLNNDIVLDYDRACEDSNSNEYEVNYLVKSSDFVNDLELKFDVSNIYGGDYIYIDKFINVYAIYQFNPSPSSFGGDGTISASTSQFITLDGISHEVIEYKSSSSSGNYHRDFQINTNTGPGSIFFNVYVLNTIDGGDHIYIKINGEVVKYINNVSNTKIPIFYSSNNLSSPTTIDFSLNSFDDGDVIYFDQLIQYIPEQCNFFESDVSVNGTMEVTGNIYSSATVGEIGMFYQYSSVPPFGYLWCDGSQLNTSTDNKYRRLIEVLKGEPKGSTTINTDISCYLPNFIDKYPLGWNGSFTNYDSSANANEVGNNSLDINYFPEHTHGVNTSSFDVKYDLNPNTDNVIANNILGCKYERFTSSQYNINNNFIKDSDSTTYFSDAHYVNYVNDTNMDWKYSKGNGGNNLLISNTSNPPVYTNYTFHNHPTVTTNMHYFTAMSDVTNVNCNVRNTAVNNTSFINNGLSYNNPGVSSFNFYPISFQLKFAIKYI